MKTTRRHHPAAASIPEATREQYEKIREDIREHGQRVPIILSSDGQIIDGRTRDRACRELGISLLTRPATIAEQTDAVALVISLNAARRHLSPDQMAAIYWSAAEDRASRDALFPATKGKRGKRGAGKTSKGIARKIGVSQATVERVEKVQREAPEKLADVAKGTVSAVKVLKSVKPVKSPVLARVPPVTRAPDATPSTGIIEHAERVVPSFELQCDQIEAALGWLEVRQERGRFRQEEVVLLGSIYARFGALMKREEVTA